MNDYVRPYLSIYLSIQVMIDGVNTLYQEDLELQKKYNMNKNDDEQNDQEQKDSEPKESENEEKPVEWN